MRQPPNKVFKAKVIAYTGRLFVFVKYVFFIYLNKTLYRCPLINIMLLKNEVNVKLILIDYGI